MKMQKYVIMSRNYLLSSLYLFIVFGSIYGLLVDELQISLFSQKPLQYTVTGWQKNLLCLFGLLFAAILPAFPIARSVYRALSNSRK
jgi:hypothetical protein